MRDALRWPDGLHTLILMAVLEGEEWRSRRQISRRRWPVAPAPP